MDTKYFFKLTRWKAVIFLLLFVAIYLIPYIKVEVDPNTMSTLLPGRYPIISGFLLSCGTIFDLASGVFILHDILVFVGFIVSFIFVYMLSCLIFWLISKL